MLPRSERWAPVAFGVKPQGLPPSATPPVPLSDPDLKGTEAFFSIP